MFAQIGILIYVVFLLLAMRLNFFMDIVTGLAFGYIVYTLINLKGEKIDNFVLNPIQNINSWLSKRN